jgi:SAM-dependent methyltransferase
MFNSPIHHAPLKAQRGGETEMSSTDRFYEDHASEYFARTFDADMSSLHQRFLSRVPRHARILDAGCGSGRDLRVFVERGYLALGIDASAALVRLAHEFSGADCEVVRLEDVVYEGIFDGVWACASLLHLPKKMLIPVLKRLQGALVRGGTLFASIQEGKGEGCLEDGRFYAYYSQDELSKALQMSGFLMDEMWRTEDVLSRSDSPKWLNVLARAN